MTLTDLRKLGLAMYARDTSLSGNEDSLFPNALCTLLFNQKHKEFAEATRCYRDQQIYDLPLGSGGTSTVPLGCSVIEIVPDSVRVDLDGTDNWTPIRLRQENDLRGLRPFERLTNTGPYLGFPRVGRGRDADGNAGQQRILELVPGAATARVGGVLLEAWIYPGDLAADTDAPGIQVAEHTWLIPLYCEALAQIDLGMGRQDMVTYWRGQALDAQLRYTRTLSDFQNPGGRRIRRVRCR